MLIRLHLFGPPTIDDDGQSFALPFERRSQLLVLLALRRAWVGRGEIAAMLWPEQAHQQASANLRKTLFRLQSVPWGERVDVQGNFVRFDAQTDVFDFEAALREHRIADALALRRGELLAGFEDDPNESWSNWLQAERDRLRVAWRGAALDRLRADIEPAEGIELSARLLAADPLDEAALRAHMQWLANSGQGAGARHAYQAFVARLAHELGLDPGADLKALHETLETGPGVARPPAPSPVPDDGFVGRAVEMQRIAALLAQDDCRLLCLIGPGGVGKSRLAQRVVRELAPRYADGAVFVALEDTALPSELGGRLARELGVRASGAAEPLDQVIEFLRERELLLVLDNFEQLAAAAPLLENLLQACTRLRILVTSRVRLLVSMEWRMPLEGLPYPEPEDVDRVASFDAVRLFVKAARRVEPAFGPAAEAAAIADICRLVDGLPLALELAAAWTRVLSCGAIAAELRQGVELLRATATDRPARHASIELVFDQSWRLLSAVERDVLARLSVFRGGFSVEAARSVAGASLPVLGALADKSLLRKEAVRIVLHPLVQLLAAARLGDGGLRASTEAAHALYFHRLLAQLRRAVEYGDREALQHMDAELENCRASWHWAIAHQRTDLLATGALTMLRYCDNGGRFHDGLALLRAATESLPTRSDPRLVPILLSATAHLECRLDRYGDAQLTASRALAACHATRDHDARLICLKVLGASSLFTGRYGDAKHYFEQALQQSPASTDPRNAAGVLQNLALIEKALGRYEAALQMSLLALVQYRLLGDAANEAMCLNNLGAVHFDMGDCEAATTHLESGLALCERHGLLNTRGMVLVTLIQVSIRARNFGKAQTLAQSAIEVARQTGSPTLESLLEMHLTRIAVERGDLGSARLHLQTSLQVATAVGLPSYQLAGLARLAEIIEAQGEAACARQIRAFAVEQSTIDPGDRDEMRERLAQCTAVTNAMPPWPGLELQALVQRVIAETPIAYSGLISLLRGAR